MAATKFAEGSSPMRLVEAPTRAQLASFTWPNKLKNHPFKVGGIMAYLKEKDVGHKLDEILKSNQGIHDMFGREWYRWHMTFKTCAYARVIGRSAKGGVRLTLDGMGRVTSMNIAEKLSKDLDRMAAEVIDAFNDARQKMHDFKKFEWIKYMERDLEGKIREAYKQKGESIELSDEKLQSPLDDFVQVLDLESDYGGVNNVLLPPYPYDDDSIEAFTKLEEYFSMNKLSMKECFEDFVNMPKYLESKGITWEQFESGWYKHLGEDAMEQRPEAEHELYRNMAIGYHRMWEAERQLESDKQFHSRRREGLRGRSRGKPGEAQKDFE